jgi:hypothetical protein
MNPDGPPPPGTKLAEPKLGCQASDDPFSLKGCQCIIETSPRNQT